MGCLRSVLKARMVAVDRFDIEKVNWNKVAARFDNIIRTGRYFTPEEQARYDEMQTREWRFRQKLIAYNDIKHDHPDDIVLFQVGDFFEMYEYGCHQPSERIGV